MSSRYLDNFFSHVLDKDKVEEYRSVEEWVDALQPGKVGMQTAVNYIYCFNDEVLWTKVPGFRITF